MKNEPFKLTKRFRHQEEYFYVKQPWSKSIINLESATILGRTPFRWLLLIIFYVLFFSVIVAFWFICYLVFDDTLSVKKPKWLLTQPGFGFQPSILPIYTNIEYYEHLEAEVDKYVDQIIETLRKYGNETQGLFGPCTEFNSFGYKNRNPCIFLKINRIIGFKTVPIEHAKDLPHEAPNELRKYIQGLSEQERKNQIWVSCDSSQSVGMEYYPTQFFSTKHLEIPEILFHKDVSVEYITEFGYPNAIFYNKDDYKRIVAVRLLNVSPNIKYHVHCNLWAKNIMRDEHGKMGWGVVRFMVVVKK